MSAVSPRKLESFLLLAGVGYDAERLLEGEGGEEPLPVGEGVGAGEFWNSFLNKVAQEADEPFLL